MNEQEATAVLSMLKAAYPNSYKDLKKQEARGVISVWAMQLADAPAELVYLAIHELISGSKFPPSVAEVREKIVSIGREAREVLDSRRQTKWALNFLKESHPDKYSGSEATEPSDFEKQAERIYELAKDFKAELSLYQLMQNDVLRNAIESPDTPLNLTLLGAKTNE